MKRDDWGRAESFRNNLRRYQNKLACFRKEWIASWACRRWEQVYISFLSTLLSLWWETWELENSFF